MSLGEGNGATQYLRVQTHAARNRAYALQRSAGARKRRIAEIHSH